MFCVTSQKHCLSSISLIIICVFFSTIYMNYSQATESGYHPWMYYKIWIKSGQHKSQLMRGQKDDIFKSLFEVPKQVNSDSSTARTFPCYFHTLCYNSTIKYGNNMGKFDLCLYDKWHFFNKDSSITDVMTLPTDVIAANVWEMINKMAWYCSSLHQLPFMCLDLIMSQLKRFWRG